MIDLSNMAIHTITTKPWKLDSALEHYARAGISGVSLWKESLEDFTVQKTRSLLATSGLKVVSLVRGGFFPSISLAERMKKIEENKRLIDLATEVGAPMIVLVCGADPNIQLCDACQQIEEGIAQILPYAEENNIKLAIEPLHPMYADTRSAIVTIKQAHELCMKFKSTNLGIAVDVYHVWWDPELENQIMNAGKTQSIFAFHVCDWKSPTMDMLNDRGIMGEGCIPIRTIRQWVQNAGFSGFNEVEIFSNRYWSMDQSHYLTMIIEAYKEYV